ncbi:hypothetical protein FG386_001467 [Cryptosporidium ryanae]|uniref:uncharacterized protein n=1 Tax=Cryptosporidium ryanae TaxID=515981 RepID=UPI00351A3BA0|nr:hypothetical protein FG386_001467 [Cryptosporidium ryanae]
MWDLEKDWSDDDSFGLGNSRRDNTLKSENKTVIVREIIGSSKCLKNANSENSKIIDVDIGNEFAVDKTNNSSKLDELSSSSKEDSTKITNKRKKTECIDTDFSKSSEIDRDSCEGSANNLLDKTSVANTYNCFSDRNTGYFDSTFIDFDDYYTTFGMNSLKIVYHNRNGRKKTSKHKLKNKSNKLFVDLVQEITSSLKSENGNYMEKEIYKFNGVYDSSKTFFIKSWDSVDIRDDLEMCLDLKNFSLFQDKYGKSDIEIIDIDLDTKLNKNFYLNETDCDDVNCSKLRVEREILTRKYVPKSCLDLVNDENTVRNILRWIKQWDEYIFGNEKRKNDALKEYNYNFDLNSKIDENKLPPLVPILLVGGPSGSGKTCIVNTLAKQCGYDINQIKVFDERIIDNFENSIKMGINYSKISNYNKSSSNKPNIILIDELDSIAMSCGSANSNDLKLGSSKKRNKLDFLVKLLDDHAKTRDVINRPIICICNDIHSKSLRLLKSKVTTILVQKPPKDKLIKRLQRICKYEKILFEEDEILSEIIRIHDSDIRSCLNSIQIMCQKECENTISSNKGVTGCVKIYWEDLEDCCYTKDAEQDASLFIKLCFGLESINSEYNQECVNGSNKLKSDSFTNVLNYGDETILNFGQGLVGLLTENIYRCNLINDFYFDYIKIILDSVSEHNVISLKTNTLIPFLQTSILVSRKIMGLHCNQFRHLGVSTYTYSQQVTVQNNNIYKDISDSSIESLRSSTLTLDFKIYTLPSILTHFNDINYLKYLSVWKSTNTIPKLKNILKNKLDLIQDKEELNSLLFLMNLISKMKCYGFKFSKDSNNKSDRRLKYEKKQVDSATSTGTYNSYSQIEPNIFSLYSLKCLANSVNTGYIRNPAFESLKLGSFIYDRGYYTLINQLIDYFGDEITAKMTNFGFKNGDNAANDSVKDDVALNLKSDVSSMPTFDQLLICIKNCENNRYIPNIKTEKKGFHCIYQFNDGFINAVKMDVKLSDLIF